MILHLHSRKKRAIQLITAPRTSNLFSPCSWHVVVQLGQLPSPSAGGMIQVVFTNGMWAEWWAIPPAHPNGYSSPALLLPHTHHLATATQTRKVPLLGQQQQYREDLGSCTTMKSRAIQTRCFPSQMSRTAESLLTPLSLGANATRAQPSSYWDSAP